MFAVVISVVFSAGLNSLLLAEAVLEIHWGEHTIETALRMRVYTRACLHAAIYRKFKMSAFILKYFTKIELERSRVKGYCPSAASLTHSGDD